MVERFPEEEVTGVRFSDFAPECGRDRTVMYFVANEDHAGSTPADRSRKCAGVTEKQCACLPSRITRLQVPPPAP